MKIRNGFVANSSSASFLLAIPKNYYSALLRKNKNSPLNALREFLLVRTGFADSFEDVSLNFDALEDYCELREETLETEYYRKKLSLFQNKDIYNFFSVEINHHYDVYAEIVGGDYEQIIYDEHDEEDEVW